MKKVCKRLLLLWMIWGSLFSGCEMIKMQIPMKMRIYEEDAVSVLSGNQKKLTPQELNLDFTGDIQLIVEGSTLSMKLINASPGIILVALGVIILWKKRYKVKITNSES